ncbi:Cof-type HAD-IIB family hydrolase [Tannockella kyphosi]|uniref:Cof-type HAD-IIB family hydrolase n=1 Tax=Tannockella kyphosi TaxID=2899121 RepID=UPI0020118ACB|nr:Cof-type HAD-IIB family hydrolase [Tannockella kyphosi]
MAIKVIIMDIDGTLVNSDKKLTLKTKEILIQAQKLGIKVVLASGRPRRGMVNLARELEMDQHHGLVVCYNGSQIIDCQTNEIIYNQAIPNHLGKAVLKHMKNFNVYPMIDKEDTMYVNNVYAPPIQLDKDFNVVEYEARGGNFLLCEKENLDEFLDWDINKILTAGQPAYLQEHYLEMMEPFKDTLSCMFTSAFYFEFTAKSIDKANALKEVLLPLGYKQEEMIAFGDGMNDLSMIEFCGIGVAMQNAVEALKEASQYITTSNDQDGIAYALLHYIPEIKTP